MARAAASLPRLSMLALVLALAVAASGDTTTVAGQFRVNCGASVSATDSDGRAWDGDAASRFAPSVSGVAAGASHEDPSLPSAVPYMTARVFGSSYTYSFPVRPGRVFLRLGFYPAAYAGRDPGDALFGVSAEAGGGSNAAAQARSKRKSRAFVAGWAAGACGLVAVLVGCLCAWGVCRRRERKAASAVVHVSDEPVRGTPAPGSRGPTETYQK